MHTFSLVLLRRIVLPASFLVACTTIDESPFEHLQIDEVQSGNLRFERLAITDSIVGPAFASIADFDADGRLDVAVSLFGKVDGFQIPDGQVLLLEQGERWTDWNAKPLLGTDQHQKWPNGSEAHDMDQDGDLDLIVGGGFLTCQLFPWTAPCGSVFWLEQTESDWVMHDIVKPGSDLFFHHPLLLDVNGDEREDIVVVGESFRGPFGSQSHAEVRVYLAQDEPGTFATEPTVLAEGLGSLPQAWDVDADGDMDLVSAEYFYEQDASYVWLENPGANDADWKRHVINDQSGPAIQFEMVPNAFGDGIARGFGSNHTNTEKSNPDLEASQLAVFTPGDDPTQPWEETIIDSDFASIPDPNSHAPGVFGTGDIDGDGDVDLLLSGDGDPVVKWYEQTTPGEFQVHILEDNFPQAGVTRIVDIDQDGRMDLLVTSYDHNVLMVYRQLDAE